MKSNIYGAGGIAAAALAALAVNVTPTSASAQAANCPAAVTQIVKTLKISPKAVLPQDIRLACIRANNKPALASRGVLSMFLAKAKISAGGLAIAGCQDNVLYALSTAGAPTSYSSARDTGVACKNAKGRPALAARNFSHRFLTINKVNPAAAAPKQLAASCPGRLAAVAKSLRINPKFANANDIKTACARVKGKPVMAMRNFLDRFVVQAKIAPSIMAPACPQVMAGVSKTLQLNPKFASAKNLGTACQRAKARPALATRNFTTAFVKQFKIDNGKPAAAAMAKTCVGKLTSVAKQLRINAKFANAKDIATACKIAKGKPALATRNFTTRFVKVAGIK